MLSLFMQHYFQDNGAHVHTVDMSHSVSFFLATLYNSHHYYIVFMKLLIGLP